MKALSIPLCLLCLAACSNEQAETIDGQYNLSQIGESIVAEVDGNAITRNQLDHQLAFYSSNPMVSAEDSRIELLNEMIEEQVMYNKAIENGFNESPEYINNQRKLLAYEYKKYLQQKVQESIKITDVDLSIYYETNKEKYTKPAMKRIALFQQRDDLPAGKLALKQVKEAAEYLKPEEGFGQYALESHHAKTANRSGKLPWMSNTSQMAGVPQQVFQAASKLKVGEISAPFKIKSATYLVRLVDERSKQTTPLDELKPSLRKTLLSEQKNKMLLAFKDKAKAASKITIFKENLTNQSNLNTTDAPLGPPGFPVK
ncbi:hypothetical protein NBRC116188_21660 [Oceaniserpentilla sp. 4NH20-0058]|uniref:peptidyl-prolyl cis-trans isomerase n=1 Tax=Oceaniserpentilla sp. 4NH20-0058 TaxID=3127660 RepID=UPI0031091433